MLKESAVREVLPFGKTKKSFDSIGFLKRYGIFILLLGLFLFAMMTPLLFVIKEPYYEVHSFMKLDPVVPTVMTKTEESSIVSYYQDYANTQAHSMKTLDALKKGVEALTPRERAKIFPAGLSSDNCAEILQKIVTVKPVSGTHLLDISISGSKPDGLATLLNKLMRVYIDEDRKSTNDVDRDRLKYLYDQKRLIQFELAEYEKELDNITRDVSTSTYSEAFNIAGKNNEDLLKLYNNALNERIKTEFAYNAAQKSVNDLKGISLEPIIDEMVMGNSSLNFTDSWTYQQLQEMRSTTDGLTASNPDRVYVEQRMDAMRQYQSKLHNEIRSTAKGITYGKQNIELRKSLITAKNEFEKSKKTEASIKKELEVNLKESKRVSIALHKGEYISTYWKHKHDLLDNIDTRITEIEVEKKAPLRLSIESTARTPKTPLKSNTNNLIATFFAISFGIVGGSFFAYEFLDNTIRRPEDIKQALGYLPTQTIVKIDPQSNNHEELSLAPDDFNTHSIGSLAIRFFREREKDNTRIILFTGIETGVGSSSVAFSCAKALAQMVPKVLMIDGDLEAPPLNFSDIYIPNLPGFCEFLNSEGSFKDYIISTPGDNIDIMYAGNLTGNKIPRQRIRELFEEIKKEYDFICIDASPLLKSHFTEHFAIYADIVALVSLGDSSRFDDLRKSAEQLVRLDVAAIAPILNFGGIKQTLSLEEIFENPQAFIKAVVPEKIITRLNAIPAAIPALMVVVNEVINKVKRIKKR